jgi:hypothetical protein
MTSLNFAGGATPDVTTSWTANGRVDSSTAANGVALPTTGQVDSKGQKPIMVASAEVQWAGRGGSRTLRVGIGGYYSGWSTVASASSASASGQKTINGIYLNGGNQYVTIDEAGTGGFYFGRATGTTGSTDGVTNWGKLTGSVVYYEAPNAPTSVTVSQAALENAVNISWTAPSSNGGTAITSYSIQWSYSSTFATSTTVTTGSSATTYKLTGLTYGSTVYVKVAASNAVTTLAGSTSVQSSSANGYITPPNLPLDGWAHFGTATNNTWTLEHTVIPALTPETGMLLTGTATATGGTYTSGSVGISKTYTDLTIGRQYIVSGKAILRTSGVPANIYRFAVTGIGNGSSVTLSSTTTGSTIPSYTFTATSTSHTVEIELAETFTVSATGVQESVAFYDYALTRVATDLTYRVQDNDLTGSLLYHFDLATQSVGAYWWVDKTNVTQFTQDFDYSLPVGTFSDEVADGNLYYTDIATAYDTTAVINQINLDNIGIRASTQGSDKYEAYSVAWSDSDTGSVTDWGARSYDLTTNLWTEVNRYNLLPNPSEAYTADGITSGAGNMEVTRQQISLINTGATGMLSSGATQAVTGGGDFVARGRITAQLASAPIAYGGTATDAGYGAFPVLPSTQYTASAYMRAGIGSATSLTGRVDIRWYTDAGATISTVSGTAATITQTGWTRRTLTATAPANAAYGVMFAWFIYGGANNTGYRYYSTCAQFEQASSASTWFSGDTTDDATYVYEWEGQPGQSRSIRYNNMMDTRTGELLTDFADPIVRVNSLTWNTAQNPVVAASIDIGSLVIVTFKGTTDTYRVVGINHDINPERWMMTLQVAKVI